MKILCWVSALMIAAMTGRRAGAATETIWVGTYTNTTSRGIYAVPFDPVSGELSEPVLAAKISNPSFLALGAQGRTLYAVDESARGRVSAFAIDPLQRSLTLLNSRSSGGNGPAHVAVDPSGRVVVAANYGGGSIASFPVTSEGRLGAAASELAVQATLGPDRVRQGASHPHSTIFSPDGRFALVCDLGCDAVMVYRVNAATGALRESDPARAAAPPGAGPRHSVFSPDGRFLYVLNEMGGSVCQFAWDEARGALTLVRTVSTLPEGFAGKNGSAEIALGAAGNVLYASNRGPDTITVFARDPESGALQVVDRTPSGGVGPRSFAISPDGGWLVCANGQSDRLVVFRIDAGTGKIAANGKTATVGRPVCLVFGEAPR